MATAKGKKPEGSEAAILMNRKVSSISVVRMVKRELSLKKVFWLLQKTWGKNKNYQLKDYYTNPSEISRAFWCLHYEKLQHYIRRNSIVSPHSASTNKFISNLFYLQPIPIPTPTSHCKYFKANLRCIISSFFRNLNHYNKAKDYVSITQEIKRLWKDYQFLKNSRIKMWKS